MTLALHGVDDPGPILPWRLVPQVLRMAAGQVGHPVAVLVLVKAQQQDGWRAPSVRRAVAFGRYGG